MIFAFHLINHNELGRRSLEDPADVLIHQLRALGHRAGVVDPQGLGLQGDHNVAFLTAPDTINVLIEGFMPGAAEHLATAYRAGARFLIIATEEPTPEGFNHGLNPAMVVRQQEFPECARYAEAVWCLVPGTAAWYGQHAPAAEVELGYARSLIRRLPGPPDYEFGFFGSWTERRRQIITRLGMMTPFGANGVYVTSFSTQAERDRAMSRAKVIVQVRAMEEMGLVSSSRLNTALHLGRPVVAEPHALSQNWREIVHFSRTTEDFYADAQRARANWWQMHRDQMRQFKRILAPERTVGAALRATRLLDRRRAA